MPSQDCCQPKHQILSRHSPIYLLYFVLAINDLPAPASSVDDIFTNFLGVLNTELHLHQHLVNFRLQANYLTEKSREKKYLLFLAKRQNDPGEFCTRSHRRGRPWSGNCNDLIDVAHLSSYLGDPGWDLTNSGQV